MADSAHINKHFEGKKTKFNEDGTEQASISQENIKTVNSSKFSYQANIPTHNVKNIHPSWAAKKEQKGIQEFAGKKIVFDDTD